MILEDSASQPAAALTKASKLVLQDQVAVLVGPVSASQAYPIADYVEQQRVPLLMPTANADDLTKRDRKQYVVRAGWSASQPNHVLGAFAYRQLGYRRVAIMTLDVAQHQEQSAGFQKVFEDLGGRVVQHIFVPLNTLDFMPYIISLRRDVDAVFFSVGASESVRLFRQLREAGVLGNLRILGTATTLDEIALRNLTDEPIGAYSAHHWSTYLRTVRPQAKQFVESFERRYGREASYYSEAGYTAALWLDRAVAMIPESRLTRDRLLEAMRRVELPDAPRGPIRVDSFGNPVQNIYIRRVQKVADRLENVIVETIPNVSQFWTYSPEEFLAQPPYSRDYPPCRYCGG